jgi:hypothetical protein
MALCDDLGELMRVLLRWDERGIRMQLNPSFDNDPESVGWGAVGLPDYFNDVASHLNSYSMGPACERMSAEEAQTAYFEALFANGFDYGFFPLEAAHYDTFIADCEEDDDEIAMPEKYRSDKRFGVIPDIGGIKDAAGVVDCWVSIGWASGRISEAQLAAAGISYTDLMGRTCVVNAFGEVESVGNLIIARSDF